MGQNCRQRRKVVGRVIFCCTCETSACGSDGADHHHRGGFYEGIKAEPEQEKKNVYRVDPKSGDIKVVVDDFVEPNGLCFWHDEKKLYICDTGFTAPTSTMARN